MIGRSLLLMLAALIVQAQTLQEQVAKMMDPAVYQSHRKLVALLFENEEAFSTPKGYDLGAVAKVLENNGLLTLDLPKKERVTLQFECDGNPIFCMKLIRDVLHERGYRRALTQEASFDGERFVWSLALSSRRIPDPRLFAERFAKRGVWTNEIVRESELVWRYGLGIDGARIAARLIEPGTSQKLVRPVRPAWIDVSRVRSLTLRELPGSHWYPDVAVYDKMLHLLSVKQSDTRTRYLRVRLPEESAYVKITDRFTLENIKSGLRLDAGRAR